MWLGLVLGLGLDYGLGFSSDIRLRQDPQLRVSHLATTLMQASFFNRYTHVETHSFFLPVDRLEHG